MASYKILFFVIGTLISANIGFSQSDAPKCKADKIIIEEQRELNKNNNVFQKIRFDYSVKGDALTTDKKRTEVISYDKSGRISEWAYYKNNTQVEAIYRYSYDSRNNISELTLFSDIGDVLEKTVYNYDHTGNLSQETFFEAGNTFVSRSTYEINTESKTITETEYSLNNAPLSKRIYYYSDLDSGKITKEEVFKQGNNLYYTVERIFNNKGNIEREDFFSPSGNLAYQFMYNYDESGNNTEKIKYSPTRDVLQKFTNAYTKSGLEMGMIEYDRQGRIISYLKYDYENY